MLLLTRSAGTNDGRDEFVIRVPGYADEILVRFYRSSGRQIRLGIDAPPDMVIMRGELLPPAGSDETLGA